MDYYNWFGYNGDNPMIYTSPDGKIQRKKMRKITNILYTFLFLSCTSVSNITLGNTYKCEIDKEKESNYIMYNSATILPLISVSKYLKIACEKNQIVYIQRNDKKTIAKYNTKQITLNDILVEPGVGFYVKLSDNLYGFIAEINDDISNQELKILYVFQKKDFSFIGDVKSLMNYTEYMNWMDKSEVSDEELNNKFIIIE